MCVKWMMCCSFSKFFLVLLNCLLIIIFFGVCSLLLLMWSVWYWMWVFFWINFCIVCKDFNLSNELIVWWVVLDNLEFFVFVKVFSIDFVVNEVFLDFLLVRMKIIYNVCVWFFVESEGKVVVSLVREFVFCLINFLVVVLWVWNLLVFRFLISIVMVGDFFFWVFWVIGVGLLCLVVFGDVEKCVSNRRIIIVLMSKYEERYFGWVWSKLEIFFMCCFLLGLGIFFLIVKCSL